MTNYPLTWPAGWKRTASYARKPGPFRNDKRPGKELTVADAVDRVLLELERMGIRDWMAPVISTNVEPTLAGRPKSNQGQPSDPGVAVYWRKDRQEVHKVMAIDRYSRVEQNLAAIAATLDAMRAIERHGGAVILERAFTGFLSLPAPNTWRAVLEIEEGTPVDLVTVKSIYKRLSLRHHPDCGGTEAKMAELNWAMAEAEKELKA